MKAAFINVLWLSPFVKVVYLVKAKIYPRTQPFSPEGYLAGYRSRYIVSQVNICDAINT